MATAQTIGVPPHNLLAERSVLGAVLLDQRHLEAMVIEEKLEASHFFREQHGEIFEAMLGLYAQSRKIDHLTVAEALAERGKLEFVGGPESVEELATWVPAAGNAREYGRIVREAAQKRALLNAAYTIQADVLAGEAPTRELVEQAERLMIEAAHDPSQKQIRKIADILQEETEKLHKLSVSKTAISGTESGFTDLDAMTGGFQPGNLIILAARPSMGKSALVTNIAENAVLKGKPVALFSLEMSESELAQRFVASQAKVKGEELRRGRIPEAQWPRILQACGRLADAPLYVDDSSDAGVLDIRGKCRRLHSNLPDGLGLIIIDYLQLMRADGRVESRVEQVGQISRGLKGLARELNVPVIALSQLSRAVEQRGGEKKPILSDLRECVTGDTPVLLADGSRVPIRDLVGTRPRVLAVDDRGVVIGAQSDAVWPVGVRSVKQITLGSGRTVRATDDHRFLTSEGWAHVRDLEPTSRLALAARLPEAEGAERWSDERVILLGQLLGAHECLGDNGTLTLTSVHPENTRILGEASGIEFGTRAWHSEPSGGGHRVSLDRGVRGWSQTGLRPWMAELGVLGTAPAERRVPPSAFRLGREQIALLLQHLWAARGVIEADAIGDARCADGAISINLPGKALAADVVALLLRLGIAATRSAEDNGHVVMVLEVAAQQRFLQRVGAFGPLESAALRLELTLATSESAAGEPIHARRLSPEPGRAGVMLADWPSDAPPQTAAGEAESVISTGYGELRFDPVVAIEDVGLELVYDLTVPEHASWLADGVVSHNSGQIEQDADLVMFIYREEYYERDSERAGEADIIIAKHRNGPVGEVVLAFQKEYPRFMNYAGERFAP